MTACMPFSRIVPLALAASVFLTACPKPPALTGTNQTFVTSGSADDGDDQTTGPPVPYVDPIRSATDGQAVAVSDPQSFRSLGGNVTAQTGAQPVRVSSSISTNKVTSTFVVTRAVTLKFQIVSSASANLNSGSGGYLVAARVLDNAGQFVPGTDFQTRFDFAQNPNGRIDVSQDRRQFTQIANGDPIQSTDKGPAIAFTLQPGTYTLQFELNIDARADTRAEIRASAMVDLVIP